MPDEPKIETKPVKTNWAGLIGLLILAALLFQCVNSTFNSSAPPEQPTIQAVPAKPAWTPPDGYSSTYTDNGVPFGYKWADNPKCDLGDWCFGMDIVTSESCPHFYASITILDKDDTNIGWTNDTAQGVRAGEKVRLVFNGYQSGVRSARLAETKCY